MTMRLSLLLALFAIFFIPGQVFAQADGDPDATGSHVYLPVVLQSQTQSESDADSQVVRIYLTETGQLPEQAHEIDLFEEPTTDGYAVGLASPAEIASLRSQGIRVEVDAERTEELRSSQADVQAAQASGADAISSIPGYSCYRTVEETYNSLSALATSKPNLAEWIDIGDTWHKTIPGGNAGYDIFALRLTDESITTSKPKFILMSAIHAREYATAELATRFAEELASKFDVDPDVTWALKNFEFYLIPQANPDGRKLAETGQLWRKNTDNDDGCTTSSQWGTDLNRNSSFKWGLPGASTAACNETYRGPSSASEPEVQAVQNFAVATFPDQRGPLDTDAAPNSAQGIFISLHSYGRLVLYPWGWTTSPAPNSTQLQTLGRKFGYFNGHQVCNGPACLYGTSGTTDDFTYGELGVASYTFEVGTSFFQKCSYFTNSILTQNKNALMYGLKATYAPYQAPAGPDALSVAASPTAVTAGGAINLTASINDTRYNSNGWGTEPTQNIQAARYSIDTPVWSASTTYPMTASDGAFNAKTESVRATLNTSGLSVGRHIIYVQGQDVSGNWGVPTAVFVTIN
jgi:carboxypeptidase T